MSPSKSEVTSKVVNCRSCLLRDGCTQPIPFFAGPDSTVVALGDAPDKKEDSTIVPFSGLAGQLLRRTLDTAGIPSDTVGYVYSVACFPHGTPNEAHVRACKPNRDAQLSVLKPRFVLVCGKIALKGLHNRLELKYTRGRAFQPNEESPWFFSVYSPAAAMTRDDYRKTFEADIARFAEMVAGDERPSEFLDDATCVACGAEKAWMDSWGLSWCRDHMGKDGQARLSLLGRELEEARDADKRLFAT